MMCHEAFFALFHLLVCVSDPADTAPHLVDLVFLHRLQLAVTDAVAVDDDALGQAVVHRVVLLQRSYIR